MINGDECRLSNDLTQQEKKTCEKQVDIEDKVAKLRQRLDEEGPFDILLGFSQGRLENGGMLPASLRTPCMFDLFLGSI